MWGEKFCWNCGTELKSVSESKKKSCPSCKGVNELLAQFGEYCGWNLAGPEQVKEAKTVKSDEALTTANEKAVVPLSSKATVVSSSGRNTKWIVLSIALILLASGGAYVGTQLFQPEKVAVSQKNSTKNLPATSATPASSEKKNFPTAEIEELATQHIAGLSGKSSLYVSPVDSKAETVQNNQPQRSASTIKLFLMITAYTMEAEGLLKLSQTHSLESGDIVGGTGVVQQAEIGTRYTLAELIELMMEKSDNTAANILIDKLGGFDFVNNKIEALGCEDTELNQKMMDSRSLQRGIDNYISAKDAG